MANMVKCPKCESIMIHVGRRYRCQSRGCGFEANEGQLEVVHFFDRTITNAAFERKMSQEDRSSIPMVVPETPLGPLEAIACPRCGSIGAYTTHGSIRTIRQATEPEMVACQCRCCGHRWMRQ